MSKGSRPRPFSVTQNEFSSNFDNIFGQKPAKPQWTPPPLPEEFNKPSHLDQQLGGAKLPYQSK